MRAMATRNPMARASASANAPARKNRRKRPHAGPRRVSAAGRAVTAPQAKTPISPASCRARRPTRGATRPDPADEADAEEEAEKKPTTRAPHSAALLDDGPCASEASMPEFHAEPYVHLAGVVADLRARSPGARSTFASAAEGSGSWSTIAISRACTRRAATALACARRRTAPRASTCATRPASSSPRRRPRRPTGAASPACSRTPTTPMR